MQRTVEEPGGYRPKEVAHLLKELCADCRDLANQAQCTDLTCQFGTAAVREALKARRSKSHRVECRSLNDGDSKASAALGPAVVLGRRMVKSMMRRLCDRMKASKTARKRRAWQKRHAEETLSEPFWH